MECPRCQGELEELSLGDVSTIACPHCGFADVPVEHVRESEQPESWREAFNRFYEQ
ncbi:zf-TFIIB domain-containing protein [Natronolimnohabitans sp. A-GB9]|uniref:TFIIB-type zinc ribbon-containing protein n=1 Tax=Natronolimnohabitans sp. A-GB9 TaxID=3069757 RepID=UPI0027B3CA04|nr:zf-TFIIB domain-containing protein [Natronolimnohabitans sp. A-GB9]MDQ2048886.1 zf-TFIIB domain-containing protein [Natronolimnohabitans sp. A-GB9]